MRARCTRNAASGGGGCVFADKANLVKADSCNVTANLATAGAFLYSFGTPFELNRVNVLGAMPSCVCGSH